jgi:hypothetical protein
LLRGVVADLRVDAAFDFRAVDEPVVFVELWLVAVAGFFEVVLAGFFVL